MVPALRSSQPKMTRKQRVKKIAQAASKEMTGNDVE